MKIECCCREIEGGTALLFAIVHSAAHVVYKEKTEWKPSVARNTHVSMEFGGSRGSWRGPDVQSAGGQEHFRISKITSQRTRSWNVARRQYTKYRTFKVCEIYVFFTLHEGSLQKLILE